MRIDIRKLDRTRDAIDDAITELVLRSGCARIDAVIALIRDLGFEPEALAQGGWYFSSALTSAESTQATRIYLRRGSTGAVAYETRVLHQRLCIAYTFEDSLLALLCRLIDPNVDLSLDNFEPQNLTWLFDDEVNEEDPVEVHVYDYWNTIDVEFGPANFKRQLARPPAKKS